MGSKYHDVGGLIGGGAIPNRSFGNAYRPGPLFDGDNSNATFDFARLRVECLFGSTPRCAVR
jgi:hypothetical protein